MLMQAAAVAAWVLVILGLACVMLAVAEWLFNRKDR